MVCSGITTEAICPVALKYCVYQEYLESLLTLDFISGASYYDELDDKDLRAYLEKQSAVSKTNATIDSLHLLVKKELRMDVRDDEATSRMRNLFNFYNALLRENGVNWVTEGNPKIAVRHVTSSLRPETLRTRLQSDFLLGYMHLKNNFRAFMGHCLNLADVFQRLDPGLAPRNMKNDEDPKAPSNARAISSTASSKLKKSKSALVARSYFVCTSRTSLVVFATF